MKRFLAIAFSVCALVVATAVMAADPGTVLQRLRVGLTDKWVVDNTGTLTTGTVPLARTNATSANTASTIVARDASGNFTAGTITAALTGNASTATALAANGSNCSAGSYPLGVSAAGAAESCTVAYYTGVTSSIGGGALTIGTCASGTATVTGATTSMTAVASSTTYPGDAFYVRAYVSAPDTVTVVVCSVASATPTSSTYQVRVFP